MPQELYVLQCYACKKFQVQIVKKIPKWKCNVCNEKQSVTKVYAQGSGKDCRQYVQQLNFMRGTLEDNVACTIEDNFKSENTWISDHPDKSSLEGNTNNGSKWSQFLDKNGSPQESDEEENQNSLEPFQTVSDVENYEIKQSHQVDSFPHCSGSSRRENNAAQTSKYMVAKSCLHSNVPSKRKYNESLRDIERSNFVAKRSRELSSQSGQSGCYTDAYEGTYTENNCPIKSEDVLLPNVGFGGKERNEVSKWTKFVKTGDKESSSTLFNINGQGSKEQDITRTLLNTKPQYSFGSRISKDASGNDSLPISNTKANKLNVSEGKVSVNAARNVGEVTQGKPAINSVFDLEPNADLDILLDI